MHATGLVPVEVSTEIEIDGAGHAKLVSEAGEPRLEKTRAGDEEQVGMVALGHQPTGLGTVRQRVAFEDDDSIEPVCENAGGAQPRHAGAEHRRCSPDLAPFLPITARSARHDCLLNAGPLMDRRSRWECFAVIREIAYFDTGPRSGWRVAYAAASARPVRPSLPSTLAT